jgi:hypothetical protein
VHALLIGASVFARRVDPSFNRIRRTRLISVSRCVVFCLLIDLIDPKGSSLDVVLVIFRGGLVVISSVRMRVLHAY